MGQNCPANPGGTVEVLFMSLLYHVLKRRKSAQRFVFMLCANEKCRDALGLHKNVDTPADMQRLVNQRAKLRCDIWRPDFRPPDKGRSKMDTPHREMRSRGYVLKQNAPFKGYRETRYPAGLDRCFDRGAYQFVHPLQGCPALGHPYAVKYGSGAVDLPTDGKSPAQVYGETP